MHIFSKMAVTAIVEDLSFELMEPCSSQCCLLPFWQGISYCSGQGSRIKLFNASAKFRAYHSSPAPMPYRQFHDQTDDPLQRESLTGQAPTGVGSTISTRTGRLHRPIEKHRLGMPYPRCSRRTSAVNVQWLGWLRIKIKAVFGRSATSPRALQGNQRLDETPRLTESKLHWTKCSRALKEGEHRYSIL